MLLLLILPGKDLKAQVYMGNIMLNSQMDVDAFSYTSVTGSVEISGADITDLSNLSMLSSIGVSLFIFMNPNLSNLDGLSGVTSLLDLHCTNNQALTNIDGLSNLSMVSGSLTFDNNNVLEDLDALSGVSSIGGDLELLTNDLLGDIDGLSGLTTVGGRVDIGYNQALANLDGLQNLSRIAGRLAITNNSILNDFCGLHTLLTASSNGVGTLTISGNATNPTEIDIVNGGACSRTLPATDSKPLPALRHWQLMLLGVLAIGVILWFGARRLN